MEQALAFKSDTLPRAWIAVADHANFGTAVRRLASNMLRHLARPFGVTDLHVRRLIDRAQSEAFLVYHGQGRYAFTQAGFAIVRYHFASQWSEMIECAGKWGILPPLPHRRRRPSKLLHCSSDRLAEM